MLVAFRASTCQKYFVGKHGPAMVLILFILHSKRLVVPGKHALHIGSEVISPNAASPNEVVSESPAPDPHPHHTHIAKHPTIRQDKSMPRWSWGQGTGINAGVMLWQPNQDWRSP